MKRTIVLLVVLAIAAVVFGATAITVAPWEMKDGETKALVDGAHTITVKRDGGNIDVNIEGGASARCLTITRYADVIRIQPGGDGIVIEPPPANDFRRRTPSTETWFICHDDHTIMRVPPDSEDRTYICPVDGTRMERRKSLGFSPL